MGLSFVTVLLANLRQLLLDVVGGHDLLDGLFHIQAAGVVAGVVLVCLGAYLTLDEVLVVVQVAVVGGDAEVAAHVLTAGALLLGHQRLVQLFAVTGADDAGAGVAEQRLHRLGQVADGGGVRLLDEQVAGVGVLEREHHQIDGLVQVHQKAGHVGVGDRDGVARLDLVDEQRNHAATAAHDVAVTGAANGRTAALSRDAGVSVDDVLHHGLGDAHGVDGVGRLVGREADDALHARVDGGVQHIVGAGDVGADGLHREELARGHLFQRRRMENVIHTGHSIPHRLGIADIADVELDLLGGLRVLSLELMTHIVLLLFVAGEDADFLEVRVKEVFQNGRTERTSTTSNHKGCVIKC